MHVHAEYSILKQILIVLNRVVTTCLLGYIKYSHDIYISMLFLVILFMKVK